MKQPMTVEEWANYERDLVDKLCAIEEGLTDWEVKFVESIAKRLKIGLPLTDGHIKKAEQIIKERA